MKKTLVTLVRSLAYLRLYGKYRSFTMAPRGFFWRNMMIANSVRHVSGCVVECGVWRGGMSAGMAEVLGPQRDYFLFDSFEGLPSPTELDGDSAKAYQSDKDSPTYFDNCSAPQHFAESAMQLSGVPRYKLIKGWFEDTVGGFVPPTPIALLRLDGDWYESTLTVLRAFYKYMAPQGLIIVDDYYAWDGCSRAVHDFLSENKLAARISEVKGVCVITLRAS